MIEMWKSWIREIECMPESLHDQDDSGGPRRTRANCVVLRHIARYFSPCLMGVAFPLVIGQSQHLSL